MLLCHFSILNFCTNRETTDWKNFRKIRDKKRLLQKLRLEIARSDSPTDWRTIVNKTQQIIFKLFHNKCKSVHFLHPIKIFKCHIWTNPFLYYFNKFSFVFSNHSLTTKYSKQYVAWDKFQEFATSFMLLTFRKREYFSQAIIYSLLWTKVIKRRS